MFDLKTGAAQLTERRVQADSIDCLAGDCCPSCETCRKKDLALRPYDFGSDKLKAAKAPMLFIHGDADGVRLEHIAEMYRLKGGEIHGDMKPRSASRLAVLPNTTHVTLMQRMPVIVPMVNEFLDAKP